MPKTLGVLLLFLFFSISSCREEEPPMEHDKLVSILTDLHIAEGFAQVVPLNMGDYETKNFDTLKVFYAHIYKKNNIDSISFNEAIDWYEQHPKLFDKVYEKVLADLSLLKENGVDSTILNSDSAISAQKTPDTNIKAP